jgi:hypothetical protein
MVRITFCLLLTAAVASAQQIKINEFDTGTPDYVELMNREFTAVNVGGWQIQTWYRSSSTAAIATDGTFTIPAGTTIQPGARLVLQEMGTPGGTGSLGACAMSVGYNFNWANNYAVEVALRNGGGQGVDYVHRNPFGGAASPNLPAGTSWSGSLTPNGNNVARNGNVDTDAAADWTVGGTASACNLNAGQTYSLPSPVQLNITTTGVGDVGVTITSSPAIPNAEFYGLYSTQNFNPNGTGPLFGIGFDALPFLYQPFLPGTPFHSALDAAGQLAVAYPPGTVPTGLFLEGVVVVINGGSLVISDVEQITF